MQDLTRPGPRARRILKTILFVFKDTKDSPFGRFCKKDKKDTVPGAAIPKVCKRAPGDKLAFEDADLIYEYYMAQGVDRSDERYACIAREAADFAYHLRRIPSYLEFRCCIQGTQERNGPATVLGTPCS